MKPLETFRALVIDQVGGETHAAETQMPLKSLPDGDVLVAVTYSSLNYKDGLAVTGKGKVVRQFPMIPGIDLVGRVVESQSTRVTRGSTVLLTGWGIGEDRWGGYAQLARVRSEWLLPLPDTLSAKGAMTIGTAGLTAMLSLLELEGRGLTPDKGEVIVTGAGGGVGSIAVALLARSGYRVVASTGRKEIHEYLRSLGAVEVLDRTLLSAHSERPLESARWAGAIDTVGGDTLAGLMRSMATHASIAVCGLAGGNILNTTVFPLILRGISLIGIETSRAPMPLRAQAWGRLERGLDETTLGRIGYTAALSDIPGLSEDILQGRIRGRIVVDVNA
ncbi:MAG TPA: MDR family oxidoreductase [Capsulimonadaceae bacterium]|nr:MDR family oxidoreductase [Capsulimonadaceae bacterium]